MNDEQILLVREAGSINREKKHSTTTPERLARIKKRIDDICAILNVTRKELWLLDHKYGGHPRYGRTKRIQDGEDTKRELDDVLLNADGTVHIRNE